MSNSTVEDPWAPMIWRVGDVWYHGTEDDDTIGPFESRLAARDAFLRHVDYVQRRISPPDWAC